MSNKKRRAVINKILILSSKFKDVDFDTLRINYFLLKNPKFDECDIDERLDIIYNKITKIQKDIQNMRQTIFI